MINDWYQTTLKLPRLPRGFHLITELLVTELPLLNKLEIGFLNVFNPHTSASLTLNENTDPDVRGDLELAASHLCPETLKFRHICEGLDDMPAHVKASLFGGSLLIPIRRGVLALGTWQGIYFCEHRSRPPARELILTLFGQRSN